MKKSELKQTIKEILQEDSDRKKIFEHFKEFIITMLQEEEDSESTIEFIKEAEDNYQIQAALKDTDLGFIDVLDDFMSNPRVY